MEDDAIVVSILGVLHKVFDRLWCILGMQPEMLRYRSESRFDCSSLQQARAVTYDIPFGGMNNRGPATDGDLDWLRLHSHGLLFSGRFLVEDISISPFRISAKVAS
jgi:hypothetical protein